MVNVIACHILLKKMLIAPDATIQKRICFDDEFNFENTLEYKWIKAYCKSELLEIMTAVGFYEKGMIPAATTMLTFRPGNVVTGMSSSAKLGG